MSGVQETSPWSDTPDLVVIDSNTEAVCPDCHLISAKASIAKGCQNCWEGTSKYDLEDDDWDEYPDYPDGYCEQCNDYHDYEDYEVEDKEPVSEVVDLVAALRASVQAAAIRRAGL